MCIPHLLYPFIHVLAIVNNAAMNIRVRVSLWIDAFNFFAQIHRREIAESHGSTIVFGFGVFFLRNLHTILHSGCTNLHFHKHCARVLSCPHFLQDLLFLVLLIIVIPIGVRWYIIVVLICISLTTNDGKHIFIDLLAICMSSLEKCLFGSSPHFLIGLLVWWFACFFLLLSCIWCVCVCVCCSRLVYLERQWEEWR